MRIVPVLAVLLIGLTGCSSQAPSKAIQTPTPKLTSPVASPSEMPTPGSTPMDTISSTTAKPTSPNALKNSQHRVTPDAKPAPPHSSAPGVAASLSPRPTSTTIKATPPSTPASTTTPSALPDHPVFGTPYPFQETSPLKLALPWTSIAPAYTTPTLAIVQLTPNSILIVSNRGDRRNAYIASGLTGYRVAPFNDGGIAVYEITALCGSGTDPVIGNLPAKNWTSEQHPSTLFFTPAVDIGDVCAP